MIVLRFWIYFLQKISQFIFPFRFQLEMRMKFGNLWTVCWQIWYPEKFKVGKISSLKFTFKKPYLSQYLKDSNKWKLKNLSWIV